MRLGLPTLMIAARPDDAWCEGLEAELAGAAAALPFGAVRLLQAMGVPLGTVAQLTGAGAIGRARVEVGADGRWAPVAQGEPRLVVAVREKGVLVDLVALSSSDGDSWALRTGEGWLLGYESWLNAQLGANSRLRLHGSPMAWLGAGGEGVCVLDWTRGALRSLRGLGPDVTIICQDQQAADVLANALRWGGLPRVVADDFKGREAA